MRNRFLYIGLMLLLAVGLAFSQVTYWRASHELQVVTSANQFLKNSVGEMARAISAKDREINRLSNSPCSLNKEQAPVLAPTASLKRTIL